MWQGSWTGRASHSGTFQHFFILLQPFSNVSRFLLIALLGLSAPAALAQKVEVKNDLILVDGQPYAGIEAEGCRLVDTDCRYYIKALNGGRRVGVVKQLEYNDPDERTVADAAGRVTYLQFVFTASGTTAETADPTTVLLRPIDVARKVVKAHLMKDGVLDEQAAADFVTHNGLPYSERRKALEAAPKVIINVHE